MLISLQLLSRPDGPVPGQPVQQFPGPQVTIGRAPECQLVLPDELRVISRHHARIARHDSELRLTCLSASAPVQVNGESVPPGTSARLSGGALVHIGGFEMRVAIEPVGIAPAAASPAPVSTPVAPARPRLDEWFDLEPSGALTPSQPVNDAVDIPLGGTDTDARIVVSWRKAPQAAPRAADEVAAAPAPHLVPGRPAGDTPAAPSGEAAGAGGAARPAAADAALDLVLDADARLALMQAFAQGAGLPSGTGSTASQWLAPVTLTPQWMGRLGALLAASVDGTLALLHSRATVKREMRAEVTVIARRQNNPLKFAPDTAAALAHLLSSRHSPGFLDPVAAVQDAHEDLLAHHLAVVAGMRAALFELIARVAPQAVMREQGAPGRFAQLFPMLHEAALWRRHRKRHADLTARLDSDFEALFGQEFTKAYEAQTRRLREPGNVQDAP